MVILFYGLEGSGKTTLGERLSVVLPKAALIDGEEIKQGLNKGVQDDDEKIRRIAEMAKILNNQNVQVVVADVFETEDKRELFKEIVGENELFTVYLSTPLEVCKERDKKGTYSDSDSDDIIETIEQPSYCNLMLDTTNMSVRECMNLILKGINAKREESRNKAFKKYNFYHMGEDMWRLNYQYKFATPIIAKCASTQMKAWCDNDNLPYKEEYVKKQDVIKGVDRHRFDVVNSKNNIPEGFVKFAIYRDPLERFNSACHFPGYDAKRVIEEFTEYTYEDGVCKDQHMRRQSDYYKPEDVDYIVKLSDLNDFLKEVFDCDITNKKKVEHPVFTDVDTTLSEEELQYVKDYYKKDWDIEKSDKIWVNPNVENK